MDVTHFVESLRQDLIHAAEAGGDEIRNAAERLALALDPAVRLTLLDALSQAACEITNELEGSSVELRLKGREPVFVVIEPVADAAPRPVLAADDDIDEAGDEFGSDEDDAVARITLRLPESLKARAEALAGSRGQSLNTWLVNAARCATSSVSVNITSSSVGSSSPGRNLAPSSRIQGWVR